MPASPRKTVLCHYHYDSLDRLADCTLTEQASSQRFYMKTRLATEIQGAVQRSIFQQEDHLLAQQRRQDGSVQTTLLATDQQRSVLNALDATQPHPLAYSPYGHRPLEGGLLSLLGFNGERPDPVTGHYLLGNGYRAFNPVLMRFNSPDSWSPFGEGGLNAYAYCAGDPRNQLDSTGHAPITPAIDAFLKSLVTGVSKISRSLSKPLAASGNNATSSASRRARSGSNATSSASRRARRAEESRNFRAMTKERSNTIKQNEAALQNQDQYNISDHTTDIIQSTKAYEIAQKVYGFKIYPDANIKHPWTNPEGRTILDVAHFDASISYYRNIMREKKSIPLKKFADWNYIVPNTSKTLPKSV